LQRETLDIQRRVLGPEHPNTLLTMYNLNLTLLDEDHFAEAEKLQRETIEIERRILGPEHPDTLNAMSNLVLTLIEEGRYPEAEKLARETLDIQRRVLGPENSDTVLTLEYEAADLSHEGRYGEAQELFRELIKTAEKKKPGLLPDAWYNFACAAAIAGHRGEALRYLGQAIDGGYWTETATIVADPDLKSLHGDPRFDALIAKARQKANSQPH